MGGTERVVDKEILADDQVLGEGQVAGLFPGIKRRFSVNSTRLASASMASSSSCSRCLTGAIAKAGSRRPLGRPRWLAVVTWAAPWSSNQVKVSRDSRILKSSVMQPPAMGTL